MRKGLFLAIIFAFSASSAFSQGVMNEVLKRMDAHRIALKTLQAEIKIIKSSTESGKTQTKEGTVKFMPQPINYWLKIDFMNPVPESFSIVNNQYLHYIQNPNFFYTPNDAFTGTTNDLQKGMFMIFLNLSRANLKTEYPNMTYFGVENVNTVPTWHLELKPKTAKSYKSIELWIDKDGMPIQSKVNENNGDWTKISLSNSQKNIVLKANDFQIVLPRETKIVKN